MPSSKREREYERRRYEKWQERQAAKRAQRRRNQLIAGGVVAVLVVAIGVTTAVLLGRDDSDATATLDPTPTSTAPVIGGEARTGNDGQLPDKALAEDREWTGTLSLNEGELGIELDGAAAPQAVANFVTLAQEGYFDGTDCHRLTTSQLYVLQCGDPTATGSGGPGYSFGPVENAPKDGVYPAGTIAMARSQTADSQGSQFFIVYEDTELPDETGYTVFGQVTSGLDVIQAIADAGVVDGATDGQPATRVTIEGVETQ
ncbi:peptidylprolyl isomerase [Cellulomonas sp. NPDC089187]|uniref:peptidylprolyl isomerase n=1 Tax=Cellulomonas sp. NPDC089187 TaxID=3154970 RepID=UPI00342294E6